MKQATAKGWFYEIVYKSSLAGNTSILYINQYINKLHITKSHGVRTGVRKSPGNRISEIPPQLV